MSAPADASLPDRLHGRIGRARQGGEGLGFPRALPPVCALLEELAPDPAAALEHDLARLAAPPPTPPSPAASAWLVRLRRLAHAALALSAAEEEGLLDESEVAQRLAQRLLVELASVG